MIMKLKSCALSVWELGARLQFVKEMLQGTGTCCRRSVLSVLSMHCTCYSFSFQEVVYYGWRDVRVYVCMCLPVWWRFMSDWVWSSEPFTKTFQEGCNSHLWTDDGMTETNFLLETLGHIVSWIRRWSLCLEGIFLESGCWTRMRKENAAPIPYNSINSARELLPISQMHSHQLMLNAQKVAIWLNWSLSQKFFLQIDSISQSQHILFFPLFYCLLLNTSSWLAFTITMIAEGRH